MNIKVEPINKVFSACGGLRIFKDLASKLKLQMSMLSILPVLKSGSARSYGKFEQMIYASIAGAECLDDIDELAKDQAFRAICGGRVYSAKSCGDFLRSFKTRHCKESCYKLVDLSFALRTRLHKKKQDSIIFDIDSTTQKQYGKKMEGCALNYKGIWGLDSIMACDEFGLVYWHDTRDGNTFSSQGAELIIHEIFSRMPKNKHYKKLKKYVRGDSAFCHKGFFNACMTKGAGFVVSMKENMYEPLIKNVRHWRDTNPKDKHRIRFYDQRECQIGHTFYYPKNCPKSLRVVLIRAVKKESEEKLIKHEDDYDYFSLVTNIGEHEFTNEKIIKFYRKRGNAENIIRELKNGFDLKHYPCLKLMANRAYGIITSFAYTLMRFVAMLQNGDKPQYAKAIRRRLVYLPCQVVYHAGQVIFRFMVSHYKEVQKSLYLIHNAVAAKYFDT